MPTKEKADFKSWGFIVITGVIQIFGIVTNNEQLRKQVENLIPRVTDLEVARGQHQQILANHASEIERLRGKR